MNEKHLRQVVEATFINFNEVGKEKATFAFKVIVDGGILTREEVRGLKAVLEKHYPDHPHKDILLGVIEQSP